MSRIYDNWDRLVAATLRKEELRRIAMRTPSDLSSASARSVPESLSRVSSTSRDGDEVVPSPSIYLFTDSQNRDATDGFDPFNLINHGEHGDVFYGTVRDGTCAIGKRVNSGLLACNVKIHEMLSHSRLVAFLGDDQNFVYRYVSKEDLSRNLAETGWEIRLNIAIGVAEALNFLHHERFPLLVHSRESESEAPGNAMISCHVYWYGRVLLELITGTQSLNAADPCHHEAKIDSVAWAFIKQNDPEVMLSIADPSLVLQKHDLSEVWGAFFVAKACLTPRSKFSAKLQMADIVSALKLSTSTRPETSGVIEPLSHAIRRALVINLHVNSFINGFKEYYQNRVKLVIHSFSDLMNATRNCPVETVAENGARERVYRAWLQRTSTSNISSLMLISVRRYYSEDVKELYIWQSQASMLSRLLHPNLVKFHGCFLKDKELFLVNEFVQNGTLEQHLFKSSDTRPLSLERRLKILIGAARGLEILHAINGQSFYESFDSSDILLDYDYNTKLLGFCNATCATALDDMHQHCSNKIPPMCPQKTGFMSKVDVVNGFGIVLFEILTGLSAKGYHVKGSGAPRFVEFLVSRLSKSGHVESIMDSRLQEKYNAKTAAELVALALRCTVPDPRARPSISEVLKKLELIQPDLEKKKLEGKTQGEDSISTGSADNCSLRRTFHLRNVLVL